MATGANSLNFFSEHATAMEEAVGGPLKNNEEQLTFLRLLKKLG
jgi:hypothetical protein